MKGKGALIALVVVLIIIAAGSGELFEYMPADKILVIQSLGGKLSFYTDSGGIKWQGGGKVTYYPKRGQFWFSSATDQGKDEKSKAKDESIQIRFNDGAHAQVSGSIAWEMPIDPEHLSQVHMKYGSQDAIEQQLIRTITEKAIYMSGPLMTSKESASEKRTMLLFFVEDQITHGIYKTETVSEKQKDPVSGLEKTVAIVQFVRKGSEIERTDSSPLEEFGIRTFNLALNHVIYDEQVERQIAAQQDLVMQVQTAMAESKTAEQRALTTEQNGKANAAQARWTQEVEKATEVTAAEKRRDVAKLDVETAELHKKSLTLEGEGEGAKRKSIMLANGGLEQKLDAYRSVMGYWADAFSHYGGSMVPGLVMGGSGTGQTSVTNANSLVEMLSAKTARDLSLDFGIKK